MFAPIWPSEAMALTLEFDVDCRQTVKAVAQAANFDT
jgi:hypothetical protein